MKLCYRGIQYDYQPIEIQVSENPNTAKFRGNTYQCGFDVVIPQDHERKEIVYRGVGHSQIKQTKFLGRICNRSSLAIEIAGKPTRFLGQVRNLDFTPEIVTAAKVLG